MFLTEDRRNRVEAYLYHVLACKPSGTSLPASNADSARAHDDLVSLGSDDSGILCSSEGGSGTRESSVEQLTSIDVSRESLENTDQLPNSAVSSESLDGDDGLAQPTNKGFLLRLLECKLFDMSMAISYLFNRYDLFSLITCELVQELVMRFINVD